MHEHRYASSGDYAHYTGQEAPADLDRRLLVRASRRIDRALIGAVYTIDDRGMPTDHRLREVLREATCAQAAWWWAKGDHTGDGIVTAPTEWDEVSIGDVRLRRNSGTSAASSGTGGAKSREELAPDAADILHTSGIYPVHPLVLG